MRNETIPSSSVPSARLVFSGDSKIHNCLYARTSSLKFIPKSSNWVKYIGDKFPQFLGNQTL